MQTSSDRQTMTQRKYWHRALTGGIGAQFDWLVATMIGAIGDSSDNRDAAGKPAKSVDAKR